MVIGHRKEDTAGYDKKQERGGGSEGYHLYKRYLPGDCAGNY